MRRLLAAAACAATLAACTIFAPLDYLQSGGDTEPDDAETGAPAEGGADAEAPSRTATTLFPKQELPTLLRDDGTALYWLNAGTSIVRRGDKAGGTPRDVGKAGEATVDLEVDQGPSGFVYWVQGKQIRRAAKDGSDAGSSVLLDGPRDILDIAVDDTTIYYVAVDDAAGIGSLERMPKGGGASSTVDPDANLDVILVTTSAAKVTYADSTGVVYTLPKTSDGGAGRTKVGNENNDLIDPDVTVGIRTDDSALFWAEENLGADQPATIDRHLLAAGVGGAVIYSDPKAKPSALAIDDTYVFWTDIQLGTVRRALKTDQAARGELLLATQPRPSGVAVDASKVYVTLQGAGTNDGAVVVFDK